MADACVSLYIAYDNPVTYDDFNRLSTAVNSAQGLTYSNSYDQYGNRWSQELNGGCTSGTTFCVSFDANNRVSNGSLTYDAAGNVTQDSAHHYYYDAEDRLIQVDGTLGTCSAPTTACYVYDVEGRRVQKTSAGVTVNYVYDIAGNQVAEVNSSGVWTRGEVYAAGKHLATYNFGTTYFDHADWLGTERARTDVSGSMCETIVSLPFGDGMAVSGSCDASPMHFTGKPRDTETASVAGGTDGLDDFDARYYSSQWGRFISADWSAVPVPVPYANLTNPQTLNLYAIVSDNPETFADLNGHSKAMPPPPTDWASLNDPFFLMDDGQPPPEADPQVTTQEQRQQTAQPDTTESTTQPQNQDQKQQTQNEQSNAPRVPPSANPAKVAEKYETRPPKPPSGPKPPTESPNPTEPAPRVGPKPGMPGVTTEPEVNPANMSTFQKVVYVISQAVRAVSGMGDIIAAPARNPDDLLRSEPRKYHEM